MEREERRRDGIGKKDVKCFVLRIFCSAVKNKK